MPAPYIFVTPYTSGSPGSRECMIHTSYLAVCLPQERPWADEDNVSKTRKSYTTPRHDLMPSRASAPVIGFSPILHLFPGFTHGLYAQYPFVLRGDRDQRGPQHATFTSGLVWTGLR